jgi:hypothetical protein
MDTSSCLAAALRKTEFITLLATNLVTLCKPASVVGLLNISLTCVNKIIPVTVLDLVTTKAKPKPELLFNKTTSDHPSNNAHPAKECP